jgi:hypothetical protein
MKRSATTATTVEAVSKRQVSPTTFSEGGEQDLNPAVKDVWMMTLRGVALDVTWRMVIYLMHALNAGIAGLARMPSIVAVQDFPDVSGVT